MFAKWTCILCFRGLQLPTPASYACYIAVWSRGKCLENASTLQHFVSVVGLTGAVSVAQVVGLCPGSSAAEKAAWTLYDACFDNPLNREAVQAAGGVPPLVSLLQVNLPNPCLRCVTCFLSQQEGRPRAGADGRRRPAA